MAELKSSKSSTALQRLIDCLSYAQAFGAGRGIPLYFRLRVRRRLVTVSVPGIRHPLHLRSSPSSDVTVFSTVFVKREYELKKPSMTPSVIVDAGANIGLASVFLANRYPEARIVALEPEAANCAIFRRNAAAYPRMELMEAGLWARDARLVIENTATHDFSFRVREAVGDEPGMIQGISIPRLLEEKGLSHIDILKLDVEGSEEVLFGDNAHEWLPRVRLLFIELHDRYRPNCSRKFFKTIAHYNISTEVRGESLVVCNHDFSGTR